MNWSVSNRGHLILGVAALMLLISTLLQWWELAPPGGLPREAGIGISDGRGFILFLMAVATLLLLTLPYAAERPMAIDHPLIYLLLLVIAVAAFVWRTVGLVVDEPVSLLPFPFQKGFGFWLAAIALIVYARGVFDLAESHGRE